MGKIYKQNELVQTDLVGVRNYVSRLFEDLKIGAKFLDPDPKKDSNTVHRRINSLSGAGIIGKIIVEKGADEAILKIYFGFKVRERAQQILLSLYERECLPTSARLKLSRNPSCKSDEDRRNELETIPSFDLPLSFEGAGTKQLFGARAGPIPEGLTILLKRRIRAVVTGELPPVPSDLSAKLPRIQ